MKGEDTAAMAQRLIDACQHARMLAPFTASDPTFDIPAAYAVLREIDARRAASGWRPVGRKIGFTNRTIWERYGVNVPMWASIHDRTVHLFPDGRAHVALGSLIQPRIEPEVVFGLRATVPRTGDARAVLDAVAWIAPGFEIVQSPFPGWKFQAADCTAAFGLHGLLVVGPMQTLDETSRDRLAAVLPEFLLTLYREGVSAAIDRGHGRNVLDSPALALQHLARLVASQPDAPPLRPGEMITTGTLTDAWPVAAGETWRSDYGTLALAPIQLTFV